MERIVWISGASSGLGLHTARALHEAGWTVVAGARSFQQKDHPLPWTCLPLDVSDEDSVTAFGRQALALHGAPAALINCAAVILLGPATEYEAQALRRVMEVNFLGTAAMVRMAVPLMSGGGRIVNFSSINGLLATPFSGAYAASKHAVEGFSEALALELSPLGFQVMLVEPGDHRGGSARYRTRSASVSPYFEQACGRALEVIARDEARGLDPARLGRRVARALQKKRMPFRLRVASPGQHLAVLLHDLLPPGLFRRVMAGYYLSRSQRSSDEPRTAGS